MNFGTGMIIVGALLIVGAAVIAAASHVADRYEDYHE